MVLESYLDEQQEQREQEAHSTKQHTQPLPAHSLPTLTKYGRWIRHVPEPMYLLSCFGLPQTQQALVGRSEQPTTHELLRHIYQRCPAVRIPYLYLTDEDLLSDDLLRTLAEVVVPLVCHLHIGSSRDTNAVTESCRLRYLLGGCSGVLEKLTLDVDIKCTETKCGKKNDQEERGSKAWPFLKELKLLWCYDRQNPESLWSFWPWLWRQCAHLEKLVVCEVDKTISQSLVEGMSEHMSNLSEITLGRDVHGGLGLTDGEVAGLLSGSRKGWMTVRVKRTAQFREKAMQALTDHLPTLRKLVVDGCDDFAGSHLVRVLSSSPNLHTLVAIDDGLYPVGEFSRVEAGTFIDRDSDTNSLKTWACEASLKVLKVKITSIPRPDLDKAEDVKETYPGEGRKIQKQVYDRIARLSNLETLWLGHTPSFRYVWRRSRQQEDQYNCMAMSLESGLHELSRLVDLTELNVSNMKTRIGVKEVQWMTEYWPRLSAIRGLVKDSDSKAIEWLKEQYPEIDTKER